MSAIYLALFIFSALEKKITDFFPSFSKFCRSPIVRSLSIWNSYDLPSASTFVHCNWTCNRVRRGFKMTRDPLHLAYEDSALLWHAQVHIFVSKHLNEVWRCNEGPMKEEEPLSSRLGNTLRWRDGRIYSSLTASQDSYLGTSSLHHSQQWWWLGVVALGYESFLA
jgi:hypothetical protein